MKWAGAFLTVRTRERTIAPESGTQLTFAEADGLTTLANSVINHLELSGGS